MDYNLFRSINDMAGKNAAIDVIMVFFSAYGLYVFIALLLLLLLTAKKQNVFWGLGGAVLTLLINWLISLIFYRNQPFVDHQVHLLLEKGVSPSFPSDTASMVFACATALLLYNNSGKIKLLVLAGALVIVFSRVFVGHHYPLDVAVGSVIGIVSVVFVRELHYKLKAWRLARNGQPNLKS